MTKTNAFLFMVIGLGLMLVSCSLAEGKVDYLALAESGDAGNQYCFVSAPVGQMRGDC
jgi:hypothetical protein